MNALAIDYVPPNRNREGHIVGIDVAVRTLLDAFARYAACAFVFSSSRASCTACINAA